MTVLPWFTRKVMIVLLLPAADGVADRCAERLPRATVLRYEDADPAGLDEVTFYCLPYMGNADSIALIKHLPAVKVIQSMSSGVDEVLDALPPDATLCNGRDLGHEEGTADLAATLVLASLRRIPEFVRHQSQRSWQHVRTHSLRGKRVLLVGYGAIGAAIEQRLSPFGVQVARTSRTAKDGVSTLSELPALAAAADVLVICIALSPGTRGLVDASVLAALPDEALVVNVARGPVIDPAALRAELQSGRLRAALDVADVEPLPAGRPEWSLPNVLITPHIGGDTYDFASRAPSFVADQAARHLAGEPLLNVVRGPIGPLSGD
jgi:phosphoglycerate dehydrogenase-like enzyme